MFNFFISKKIYTFVFLLFFKIFRKMVRKFILYIILISLFSTGFAQVKNGKQKNLEKYFVEEQWEDLCFKSERMILGNKYADDPEVLLYLGYSWSRIFLLCLEKPELLSKYPEYLDSYKNALNYAQQAVKKDKKTKTFFPDNNNLLADIATIGYYYIDNFVNTKKKYPKANSFFTKIEKIYSDVNMKFMRATLAEMSFDTITSNEIYNKVFAELDTLKPKPKLATNFYMIEACDYFAHFQVNKDTVNTANIARNINRAKEIIEKVQKIYPDNELLVYLIDYLENPNTSATKPDNKMKSEMLKNLTLSVDGEVED